MPPNTFGIPFGIAGLAQCWGNAARQDLVPQFLPNALLILAAAVWAASWLATCAASWCTAPWWPT